MNNTKKTKFCLLALMALVLGQTGCGVDPGPQTPLGLFPNLTSTASFYITSSNPSLNDQNVSTESNVFRAYFNNDLATDLQVRDVIDYISVQKDINGMTSNVTITEDDIEISGKTLSLTIKDVSIQNDGQTYYRLADNAMYIVTLQTAGFTDIYNNTLYDARENTVFVNFSTSTQFGNSLPGPPKVVSIQKQAAGTCFGAVIQFSEDILFNSLNFNVLTGNNKNISTYQYAFEPVFNSLDTWRIFPTSQAPLCNFANLQKIAVQVIDAVDLEGNRLECGSECTSQTF